MTWSKLDDGFWSDPRIVAVGNEAAGAYARALSYCGCHETDGAVPQPIAKMIAKTSVWSRLEDSRLVESVEGGVVIPDYLEFNPSRATLEAKRRADRERKAQGK